jgi:CBS domain containing-hemolysin-like protein
MILVILLFVAGVALSAFFSGSETGFYRVTRVRLLIDWLAGDWLARGLLWTTNHPSVFVATALVGNNLANYIASLAVVMGTQRVFTGGNHTAELLAPMLIAPVVFIYGELLPKRVFYDAPNQFLRRCAPGLAIAAVLFAPVTVVLWLFNKCLQRLMRQSPRVLETLAHRELSELLMEGHEVGILQPAQQTLAQAIFRRVGLPIREFVVPFGRYPRATTKTRPQDVLRLAARQQRALIPVEEASGSRRLVGYIRAVDIAIEQLGQMPPLRSLVKLRSDESYLSATTQLIEQDYALGQVVDETGKTLGFVSAKDLMAMLLSG